MPSYRAYDSRAKPYAARVQLLGKVYWLGYYPSRYYAMKAEEQFKRELCKITEQAHQLWRETMLTIPHIIDSTPRELSA